MTIVESIKCVLQQNNDGLTSKQIYDEIIRQGLYSFGAENPVGVVNAQLRRRCIGLDFPTAYPIKFFEIAGYEGKKIKFRLISTENTATIITAPKTTDISELLPEEKIKAALQEHLQNIRQQVFDSVLNNSPEFFEHLVVDLLLKMGYGYDKNSGIVTGKPHDGGIDGIISEDKLGLDLIYIQAKRFANGNKVTRHDLQAFIGAMEHINKGVFITTSSFTRSAIQFIEKQQQKNIKLIDGNLLADLLVKYEVGVAAAQTFKLYNYMHSSSDNINRAAGKDRLNIKASVIYPEPEQTFWSRVIGLGYPTPEPPGFRWCTDRLKIMPMNKFVNERIKESGEIIILLGVRKGESLTRMKTITAREIEGKLLNMHNDIPNAYVYNPITEIPNDLVWEFLLKGDCRSPWGSDMKYLFSLYQGENLGEEKSVLGEVDREKIPVTGNSRFGCWCCTMVKEDKSLQNFINKGATELIPLREFRNELLRMRENSQYRDSKRRNGSVYKKSDGSFGMGPFTLEARCLILEKLLDLENRTGMELITEAELKAIDKMWDEEGDLTCRALVETYHKVKGKKLPWDDYKTPRFDDEAIQAIRDVADK